MLTVAASSIVMTTNPTGLSPVGSVTYTCVTAEANPTANVLWYKNNQVINTGIVNDVADANAVFKQRRSTLTFTAAQSDNQAVIRCAVEGNTGQFQEHTLSIKCMYYSINFV